MKLCCIPFRTRKAPSEEQATEPPRPRTPREREALKKKHRESTLKRVATEERARVFQEERGGDATKPRQPVVRPKRKTVVNFHHEVDSVQIRHPEEPPIELARIKSESAAPTPEHGALTPPTTPKKILKRAESR
jgi:hypothetical protein